MSKRRATGQITPGSSAKRPHDASSESDGRAQLFSARLKSLNQQFAEWVKKQAASHTDELWLDGVQSYQDHVAKMLQDFKDIVGEEVVDAHNNKQRDTFTPTPGSLFKTPVGTAAGRDASAAPGTGGSTGRRSVTFADTASAHTPAPRPAAAAANGTPAHANTVNAGHTPAPANFGRYDAGTPGGDDMPTPQFKLPPASNAGTPAATPASQSGTNLFGTPAAAPGDNKEADTAAKTPSSSGGFAFGAAGSGFGTPVATTPADSSAKAGGTGQYSFGTPAPKAAAADTPDGAPAAQQTPGWGGGLTFGTPAAGAAAAGSEAAAPNSSTPTFGGFGASSSGKDSTDKGAGAPAFSFGVPQSSGRPAAASSTPAPTSGTAGSSAAAAADEAGQAASKDKPPPAAFSFGVASSTPAAGGTGSSTAPAAASSPAFAFGVPSSGAAVVSSSSSPVVTFGVGSSANAGSNNSGTPAAAATGSTPPAFSFGAGSSNGGAGASGSSPPLFAFGAPAAGSTPGFGTPATGGFGAAANGTPGSFFKFPAPSDAAGGSVDGAGEAGADEEAEPQEEAVPVARSARYNILWSKTAILHISTKNKDTGAYEWQNRGKGECSIRQDTQEPDKHYISFNLAGNGKQLVMQPIKATTNPEPMAAAPTKVAMTLTTMVNTFKPAGEGKTAEPVTNWEQKHTVMRFGSAETVQEFIAQVDKVKPAA